MRRREASINDYAIAESEHGLLLRAVKTEAASRGRRVELSLVPSARPGTVDITNADIEAVFAAEDTGKHGNH